MEKGSAIVFSAGVMKRYLQILFHFLKLSIMLHMAYVPSFLLAIIGKVLRIGLVIFVYNTLFMYTTAINGWTRDDLLLLAAFLFSVEFIATIFFHRNLFYYMPDLIRKGQFDGVLVQPLNPLFHMSFRTIDVFDIFSSVPVFFIWGALFRKHILTAADLPILFFLVALGVTFAFSIAVIWGSWSFRTVLGAGAGRLYEQTMLLARFPTSIYHKSITFALTFVFPLGIIATIPAEFLRGTILSRTIFGTSLVVFGVLFLSLAVWRSNLRKYSSASS